MEYVKHVANPIMQVAPRRTLRGFIDDYGGINADVIYLPGEIHHDRKPVS